MGWKWEGPRRMRERQKRRKKRGCNWSNFLLCCIGTIPQFVFPCREREAGGRKGGRLEGGMEGDGLLGETVQYRDREWQRASGSASHLSRWYRNGCKHSNAIDRLAVPHCCYRSSHNLNHFLIPINRLQNMMTMY